MLILKLDLPEAKVSYNKAGSLVSAPVPFTPEKIKSLQLALEITGYQSPEGFFAFKADCEDKALTTQEQLFLLRQLGFKTMPIQLYPNSAGAIDFCIKARAGFSAYNPVWWDTVKNEEFKLPFLATIKKIAWVLDEKRRLAEELTTDKGIYYVIDHRHPEYFQVGLSVKVFNGEVQPYVSGGIVDKVPTHCPVCNNPLSKFQFSNDLPLIIKCNHPVCKLMKTTEEPVLTDEQYEELEEEEAVEEVQEELVSEDHLLSSEELEALPADAQKPLAIVDLDGLVDETVYPNLMKIETVQQFELGSFTNAADVIGIVVKSRRSVTKAARQLADETNLPLIPTQELGNAIKQARRND